MNQEEQEKLIEQLLGIISSGLSGRAIARHTGISYDLISKFKKRRLYLCPDDAVKLKTYLDKVIIPDKVIPPNGVL